MLDPFAGRGTTGIVCTLLGRSFTGIDLYPTNVSKAAKNIKDAIEGRITLKLDNIVENISMTNNIPSLGSYLNS